MILPVIIIKQLYISLIWAYDALLWALFADLVFNTNSVKINEKLMDQVIKAIHYGSIITIL